MLEEQFFYLNISFRGLNNAISRLSCKNDSISYSYIWDGLIAAAETGGKTQLSE